MAPLLQELSSLEIEPLETVVHAPSREGFYTVRSQDCDLDTLTITADGLEVAALLIGTFPVNDETCVGPGCCCCCCPCCCA